MVGHSDSKDDAVFVRSVFSCGNGRTKVGADGKTKNAASHAVSKTGRDVFGCNRLCQTTDMGVAEFSNIGCADRDDKNTAVISGMFDRYFMLRFLNWIKSSLE